MMRQTQGIITLNEKLTSDIYRLTIKTPEIATDAKPGQFVMVKADGLDPLLRRPFSIHQVMGDKIAILFKQIGKGTALLSKMSEGGKIDIVGPLGNSFKWQKDTRPCLIGGGMGIAPLLFLGREMCKDGITPHIMLGARNQEEMAAILPEFKALSCPLTYATDDGSMGHKGFIIDCMIKGISPDEEWQVYTCGPYPMMAGIAKYCQDKWPCTVSMETMMACGISACLGCTIAANKANPKGGKYLHVCKDGPVFSAEEIQWQK